MKLFHRKEQKFPAFPYDPAKHKAILHCSICNGEQVAGFRDLETGEFTEITFIADEKELEEFRKFYHVKNLIKEY